MPHGRHKLQGNTPLAANKQRAAPELRVLADRFAHLRVGRQRGVQHARLAHHLQHEVAERGVLHLRHHRLHLLRARRAAQAPQRAHAPQPAQAVQAAQAALRAARAAHAGPHRAKVQAAQAACGPGHTRSVSPPAAGPPAAGLQTWSAAQTQAQTLDNRAARTRRQLARSQRCCSVQPAVKRAGAPAPASGLAPPLGAQGLGSGAVFGAAAAPVLLGGGCAGCAPCAAPAAAAVAPPNSAAKGFAPVDAAAAALALPSVAAFSSGSWPIARSRCRSAAGRARNVHRKTGHTPEASHTCAAAR